MMQSKKDFPIFKNIPQLVYLDSAATSHKPQSVIDAISAFYATYNANIHRGLYPIAEKATEKVEEVRQKVAKFINAKDPAEIIFTKSTTEGINLVMYGWGKENITANDVIMTTVAEHHANFVPWQILASEKNALLDVIDIRDDGYLDERQLLEDITSTKLLAISSVSNVLGPIVAVPSLIKKIREKNKKVKIIVDAAQEVPHTKVDVQKMDCDFLVFSGHKMLAGMGVGVLYVRKDLLYAMRPFLYGGDMIREVSLQKTTFADMPTRFEAGTLDIAAIISLGSAIDYIEHVGFANINKYVLELMEYSLGLLERVDGLTIYGSKKQLLRGSLVSFGLEGIHPHDVAQILADENICVRSGHHCTMPLHQRLGISASIRQSLYLYNDEEDIDKLIKGIKKSIQIFRK